METGKRGKKRAHFTDVPADSDDEDAVDTKGGAGDATTAIIETVLQEADKGKERSKAQKTDPSAQLCWSPVLVCHMLCQSIGCTADVACASPISPILHISQLDTPNFTAHLANESDLRN